MAKMMRLGNQMIHPEDMIPLVTRYRLLPQLLCESIVDEAIAPITCTPEETAAACQAFYQQHQLTAEADQQAWIEQYGLSLQEVEAIATRQLRIEKFKQATWGIKLESFFLRRSHQLDRVIYSLIRTKDFGIAQELFFRLESGEQSFAELAQTYSQGIEANTGGVIGPLELGTLHPQMADLLRSSQPGQLRYPVVVDGWVVIARLEKILPAQFDPAMRQRLLRELFDGWLQEQIQQLPSADRLWLGVKDPKPDLIATPTAA